MFFFSLGDKCVRKSSSHFSVQLQLSVNLNKVVICRIVKQFSIPSNQNVNTNCQAIDYNLFS